MLRLATCKERNKENWVWGGYNWFHIFWNSYNLYGTSAWLLPFSCYFLAQFTQMLWTCLWLYHTTLLYKSHTVAVKEWITNVHHPTRYCTWRLSFLICFIHVTNLHPSWSPEYINPLFSVQLGFCSDNNGTLQNKVYKILISDILNITKVKLLHSILFSEI